jgi:hypothetical protein
MFGQEAGPFSGPGCKQGLLHRDAKQIADQCLSPPAHASSTASRHSAPPDRRDTRAGGRCPRRRRLGPPRSCGTPRMHSPDDPPILLGSMAFQVVDARSAMCGQDLGVELHVETLLGVNAWSPEAGANCHIRSVFRARWTASHPPWRAGVSSYDRRRAYRAG